jgi:hypothetical protein
MGECGKNRPGEMCDFCIGCEMAKDSYYKRKGCDAGCALCEHSGCHSLHMPQENTDFTIKFIHTPKCKDCTPTPSMLKRRSCAGCTKLMYKNK